MKFNIDKCYTMQVGRKRHNILITYTLHDHPLPITDSAKYPGVTITNDLKWNKHVSNITSKANSTLGILRRNLRLSSHTVKTHAYQALVRPHLEYASTEWDPYTHYNTQKLEMVQRRASRYVCNRWHNTSSVTGMLSQLVWVPLAMRRANTRLCMMYRVAHTPVGDPWTPWLTFAQRTTRGSHAWKTWSIYDNGRQLVLDRLLWCVVRKRIYRHRVMLIPNFRSRLIGRFQHYVCDILTTFFIFETLQMTDECHFIAGCLNLVHNIHI